MKTASTNSLSVSFSRWAAYATASAASAFGGANIAHAEIHYSGRVDVDLDPGYQQESNASLPLDQAGDFIHAQVRGSSSEISGGDARLFVGAVDGASLVGFRASRGGGQSRLYLSKLHLGQHISKGNFEPNSAYNQLAYFVGYSHSQFEDKGRGFVGFRFNDGTGTRYGWARLYMTGAPKNSYRLVDYAYGDVGEPVRAGQKSDREVAPFVESLGGLAAGAAALLLWRRQRGSQTVSAKNSIEC